MSDENLKILGAIAAATAAIVVAVLSAGIGFISNRSNQRDIERLKAQLLEDKGESDAKRAYAYEALKRLYAQYEPIRFHLVESVEAAIKAIQDLADIAKTQTSESEGSYPQGKYLRAARVYHLLAPAAYFKIMQSRLTLVDLAASKPSYLQYLLAKHACLVLTCDREAANYFSLPYTPYVQGWRELRQQNPERFRRQGFAFGRFDNAVCAIIRHSEDGTQRVLTFGDFEEVANAVERTDYNSPLGAALDLFDDFSPNMRPVLWRCLLVQFSMYQLFVHAARTGIGRVEDVVEYLPVVRKRIEQLGISSEVSNQIVQYLSTGPLAEIYTSHSDA